MENETNKSRRDEENILRFLQSEYEKIWKHLVFIHEDRTKYIAAFISLFGGTGYLFFRAIDGHKIIAAILISIFAGLINWLFLNWFVSHRVSALYYLNHLNLIRGKLWEIAGENQSIKKIILSTEKNEPDKYSREFEFYRIIILLIGLNIGTGFFLLYQRFLHWCCLIGYLVPIIILLLSYLFLNKWFKKKIKKDYEGK